MSAPYSPNLIEHSSEGCTVCAARRWRHQARNNSVSSDSSSANSLSVDDNAEEQITTSEPSDDLPPPSYSRRRRHQRIDVDPPTYTNAITSPPSGVNAITIPVTVRHTEIIILEDDGYSKVICPTARKFKTHIKVYESMDWDILWECLKQLKPSITLPENALKEVRGLRRKGKWERVMRARFVSLRLKEENWEVMREEICSGEIDKLVVAV
jgi:hypothetical protein